MKIHTCADAGLGHAVGHDDNYVDHDSTYEIVMMRSWC